jgi:peptidoglycan/LPS O-acetylase OafA/YrhL
VSSPKQTSRYYRPELDAVRFFAFLCVLLFHRWSYVGKIRTDLLQVGIYGLPLFFLLIAFLITELLLREREQTGTVHIAAFYIRRVLRIWPLYFAVFWGLWLLGRHIPGVSPAPGAWLPFTFFLGNWLVIHHGWMTFPVDPLWSIAVEEQFYLFIPTLARFGGASALALVGMVLLAVSYSVAGHFALHPPAKSTALWCNSFFQFQFFAGGMLLAVLLHGRRLRIAPAVRLAMGFGGLAGWARRFCPAKASARPSFQSARAGPWRGPAVLGTDTAGRYPAPGRRHGHTLARGAALVDLPGQDLLWSLSLSLHSPDDHHHPLARPRRATARTQPEL